MPKAQSLNESKPKLLLSLVWTNCISTALGQAGDRGQWELLWAYGRIIGSWSDTFSLCVRLWSLFGWAKLINGEWQICS